MSRIGKKPVGIPKGVEVSLNGQNMSVKGPKGELAVTLSENVTAVHDDNGVTIAPVNKSQTARSFWGLSRSLVQNLITGVSEGFTGKLPLKGVGSRASMQGKTFKL